MVRGTVNVNGYYVKVVGAPKKNKTIKLLIDIGRAV